MSSKKYDVVIVGGGAAGFFAAIQLTSLKPALRICILEKSNKVLAKVKVSGGGRCNVTHSCSGPYDLATHYPRGLKKLKSVFEKFDSASMVKWLNMRGVELHTEEDGRMFPVTNNSQTIIDCFVTETIKNKVEIKLGVGVKAIQINVGLEVQGHNEDAILASSVLIATGGNTKPGFYELLKSTRITIDRPIPSLFTFNDPTRAFSDLMGLSVTQASVRIEGTKFHQSGPVLITHWGFSGPAIIKLSAWAAEYLFEKNYAFKIQINWTGNKSELEIKDFYREQKEKKPKSKIVSNAAFAIPARLWEKLCSDSEIDSGKVWGEANNKQLNKLMENLIRCSVAIAGKTTYKEEFVTCGGVALEQINFDTMECKEIPGLFFAGEVLNVDGETGGFNFQAAWSTSYVAASGIVKHLETAEATRYFKLYC